LPQEPITTQVDFFDAGPFAHLRFGFCYLLLIPPLPFQLFKQGKKKTPSRRPAFCARCNKTFTRPYDANKHFNKGICKQATSARAGTLEHLIKPKPMAPAPTSSFLSSPSSSGSSFKNTPDFTGWFQNASALSLGLAQVCMFA
jgi:hypothetical protein